MVKITVVSQEYKNKHLNKGGKMSTKVQSIIVDNILQSLDNAVIPWRKPWVTHVPTSVNTSKEYRGINNLLLSTIGESATGLYLTFKQVKDLGAKVNKGVKALPVVYHMFKDKDKEGNELKNAAYLGMRYYNVFAVEDTTIQASTLEARLSDDVYDRIALPREERVINADIESFIACVLDSTGLQVKTSNKAYYAPNTHTLAMPPINMFKDVSEYYAAYFHELVHSTMAECGRDKDKSYKFASHDYSFEELVAEIGAQFICDRFRIQNAVVENSNAYIRAWVEKLARDKSMVIKAASQAQKAVDYLIACTDTPF